MISNKHRLRILNKHISLWLERNGISQLLIAQNIVEQFSQLGLNKSLQIEEISFMDAEDVFTNADTNRQKIFRWLGVADNGTKRSPARLFFVEQAIVAAMPLDLRISYLNEVYDIPGLYIGVSPIKMNDELCCSTIAASLTKENMEAQISMIELEGSPKSIPLIRKTHKELRESVATSLAAINLLEERHPELHSNQQNTEGAS
ncbi:toxin YdaT family protein [Vibrio penaeicida]|uniref:toxin YdaT family protein n=1 Tax=Vibrio penaeicida TaxID=104609 RepID=UPI002736596D|nr:toxin YdaT family protein [Vibrio penaeicida]MDP2575349.1 toxin YdaT family protein [Vibrio penaeicida]